jgi:acetyl-CoA synthase
MIVDVSGRKMQTDFEPILERQFHYFINGVEGIQHNGQRDIAWTRVSKNTFAKGFRLDHFGKVIHARIHEVFGNIVDKVQVYLTTDEAEVDELMEEARVAYQQRNERIATLTDESVDTFYSCLLCQSFAPNHVCVVNPERVGLCGAYNWLDCKASYEINPTGPNQPVPKGVIIDPVRGEFSGPNEFIYNQSNQTVDRVTFYSIMEAPMTSCGCFECIMVLVPEANGFMIVSREDPSMTPCGMTFSTLAGTAGGGMQTPGMMGMGKFYLTSKKFIPADGGLSRIVWMSSNLRESMRPALQEVCERDGVPDLLDKIADETVATSVEELLPFLEEKGHPALTMDPLF